MKTVTNPAIMAELVARLTALREDTPRKWGTMTAGEMLCHLGDATDSVLDQPEAKPARPHRIVKFVALRLPVGWPHGMPTPDGVNPKTGGTKPTEFERDRQRAIDGLRALAEASAERLIPSHGAFGPMSASDWMVWGYRHTDHHLRQFGM